MKRLIITALCFFSIFTFFGMNAQAAECHSGMTQKEIQEKKECAGVITDDGRIFEPAWTVTYLLFVVTSICFIWGVVLIIQKKKKEKAILLCLSPLVPICLFYIIKTLENLM